MRNIILRYQCHFHGPLPNKIHKRTRTTNKVKRRREKGVKKREEIFDINVFVVRRFWCSDVDLDFKSRPGCICLTFVGPASDLTHQYHEERCIEKKKGRHGRYNSTISLRRRIGTIMSAIFRRKSEQDCCQATIRLEDSLWRSRNSKLKKTRFSGENIQN